MKDVQKSIANVRKAINDTMEKCRHKVVMHKEWRVVDLEATRAAVKKCNDGLEAMIPKVLEAQLDQHFE